MLYYLVILFGLDVILQNFKLFRAVRYLELLRKNVCVEHQSSITEILIPVLNEQSIISDTVDFFGFLSDRLVKLFIIGSPKETQKTLDVACAYSAKQKLKGINFELPSTAASKAAQLNYHVSKNKGQNIWYFVFDVDSRPEKDFISRFYGVNPRPDVIYQMPSNYLNNIRKDGSVTRDALAINQTIYSIGVEFYNSVSLRLFRNFALDSLIGHGLIINQKLLDKIGYFPDPIEDSRLANIASLKNIKIKSIPVFDFGMVPGNLKTAINQYSGWFYGQTFIFGDMKDIFCKKYSFRAYANFLHRCLINLYWLAKTPFVILVLALLLFSRNYVLLIVFVLLLFLNHLKIFYLNAISPSQKLTFRYIFRSLAWDFIYSLGPLYFLVKLLRKFLTNSRQEFLPKTDKVEADLYANN